MYSHIFDGLLDSQVQKHKSIPRAFYAETAVVAPGDFDGDNDVDANDLAIFQGCITGTNLPGNIDCAD